MASETDPTGMDRPSMLDLVRLSPKRLFPPGGEPLYRQIALLTDLTPGDEVLDIGSGTGVPLEYFVRECGAVGYAVEPDPELLAVAEDLVRGVEGAERFHFQPGSPDDLPYRDGIFDVVVGELGLVADRDPAAVIRELCRVAKPGAAVVLVQLVWTAPVDEERREVLCRHLGARPLMLVEWKRLLREAGVEGVHTEDWSDVETSFRAYASKPFPDFSELFSLTEKLGILRRAWAKWGWRGLRAALARQREVHRLLTRERILGLYLVKGRKAPPAPAEEPAEEAGVEVRPQSGGEVDEEPENVKGLPLFEDG